MDSRNIMGDLIPTFVGSTVNSCLSSTTKSLANRTLAALLNPRLFCNPRFVLYPDGIDAMIQTRMTIWIDLSLYWNSSFYMTYKWEHVQNQT
jgi:hypothetical protein